MGPGFMGTVGADA